MQIFDQINYNNNIIIMYDCNLFFQTLSNGDKTGGKYTYKSHVIEDKFVCIFIANKHTFYPIKPNWACLFQLYCIAMLTT